MRKPKGAAMLTGHKRAFLLGAGAAFLLSACAAGTLIGAGCLTYAEARPDMPLADIDAAQAQFPSLISWLEALDVGMTAACVAR